MVRTEDATKVYRSIKGLLAESEAIIGSYDPADIADEDGNLCIIVDTIKTAYDFTNEALIDGIEHLDGGPEDCCEDCRKAGELRDDCEWLAETLEALGDAEADRINTQLPEGTRGHFYFSWHEGAYVLMYQIDAEDSQ